MMNFYGFVWITKTMHAKFIWTCLLFVIKSPDENSESHAGADSRYFGNDFPDFSKRYLHLLKISPILIDGSSHNSIDYLSVT